MTKIIYNNSTKVDKPTYKIGDWFLLTNKNLGSKYIVLLSQTNADKINFLTVEDDCSDRMFNEVEVENANCITEKEINKFDGIENYNIEKVDVTITVDFAAKKK